MAGLGGDGPQHLAAQKIINVRVLDGDGTEGVAAGRPTTPFSCRRHSQTSIRSSTNSGSAAV